MRDRKPKDAHFTSSAPQPDRPNLIDEARALYTLYTDRVVRDIRQSSSASDNTPKPLWLKIINVIGIVAALLTVAILIFGMFTWSDLPIRQTPTGYVGKTGLPHTQQQYELFKQWEKSLALAAPFAFIVNIGAAVIEKRLRRR